MNDESTQMVACIPRLRRYARALVGDRAIADDLVQDTLERGWQKLVLWRRGGDMRAWLFSIMHNLHVDQRRKPALATTPMEDEIFEMPTRATQADGLELRDLQAAFARLPAEQREVMLLIVLEEMTYQEVAKALDLPLGTVMSRLSRGRARLRIFMDGGAAPAALAVVK